MIVLFDKACIAFLFIPFCFTSHLEKYLIETRKSKSINSLFQTLTPCQLTLITNHHSNIQFLSQTTPSKQIFNLPSQLQQQQLSNLFSKESENSTYPVFLGQQYNVKLSAPVCKVNLLFYGNGIKQKPFVDGLKSWLENIFNFNNVSLNIASHKHISSRSVYCASRTYHLLLWKKEEYEMLDTFYISYTMARISKFWIISSIPLDTEFLKSQTSVSIWFRNMVCGKKNSHCSLAEDDILLAELTCERREESFSNYVCSFTK